MQDARIVADLEDELGLDEMDPVAGAAGDAGCTKLRHPGVVEAARAEGPLDQVPGGWHARTRLAGVNRDADVARRQADSRGLGRLGHPDRMALARAEHRPPRLPECSEA